MKNKPKTKKMSSLRLHPKFGVNPTIPACFWCGKDKNEVALLGAAYKDEAPMRLVIDYDPCETCKGQMAQGVTLIEVSETKSDTRPAIKTSPDIYPTGAFAVIRPEAVENIFGENSEAILKHKRAFVEVGVLQRILPRPENPEA